MKLHPSPKAPCDPTASSPQRTWMQIALCVFGLLSLSAGTHAATSLSIHQNGTDPEGFQQFELHWSAISNATYKIQFSTNLESGFWETVEVVTPSGAEASYKVPPSIRGVVIDKKLFSRLILPQPEIYDVQPAFIDSEDPGAALYLLGQLLPTNALVLINGQIFAGTNDGSGSLRVGLNGLPPGEPIIGTITVMDAGSNVVATLPVQAPLLYGPTPTSEHLQGPPTEPPASPQALLGMWASRKGYDYYQAQSQMNSAGLHANPYFQNNDLSGEMNGAKKGYDYYRNISDLSSANAQNNPYFRNNENAGEMPMAARKGYQYYMAQTDLASTAAKGSGSAVGKPDPGRSASRWTAGGGVGGWVEPPAALSGNVQCTCPGKCEARHTPVVRSNISNNRSSGEVQCAGTDLAIPGVGLDFVWKRTYRSRTGPTTAQGAGWDYSYNVSLTQNRDGTITLRPGNGRADTFYPTGTNWVRDEYFCEIRDLNSDGMPDVLFADTGKWLFNPASGSPAPGKLWQIIDRNGNTITLDYDVAGRLAAIVDTLNRTNTVAYDSSSRISSVTDFSGRTVRYEYDSNGDLVRVISPEVIGTPTGNDFPGGITNRYTYSSGYTNEAENHLLLAVIDGKGQAKHEFVYQHNQTDLSFLRCISVQSGGQPPLPLTYVPVIPAPTNGFAIVKTIVRDSEGNVTEGFYDARHRSVRLLEYTGRAPNHFAPTTETLNRPTGKLRDDDPDFFETRWNWNRDSLCTLESRFMGAEGVRVSKVRRIYHQEFGPTNPQKKGDLRVLSLISSDGPVDLDGDGVGDTEELTWRFDYDLNFGSPANLWMDAAGGCKDLTVRFGRPAINTALTSGSRAINTKGTGATVRVRGGKFNQTAGELCDDGFGNNRFCISATDPRGNVITTGYDAKGNQTNHEIPSLSINFTKIQFSYGYNPQGQLTAITNAADAGGYRAVTRFVYGDDPFTPATEPPLPFAILAIEDADGLKLTNRFSYDARGNLTQTFDPLSRDWRFTYNALDNLIRIETPTNLTVRGKTDFTYDHAANVQEAIEELRDANDTFVHNITNRWEYDWLDQCTTIVSQVSPGVFVTNILSYDGNGQLMTIHSPRAVSGADPYAVTQMIYDERGLLYRSIAAPASPLQSTTQFDYDATGLVTRISDGLESTPAVTTLEYDGLAPAWVETVWNKQCVEKDTTVRLADQDYNIKRGVRLKRVTDPMGNVTTFTHDANANLKMVRQYGELHDAPGTNGNILLAQSQYQYDALNRLVLIFDRQTDTAGQAIGDGYRTTGFAYAPNGCCTSITDDLGRVTSFYYDTARRSTNVTSPDQRTSFAVLLNGCGEPEKCTQTDRSDLGGPPQVFIRTNVFDSLGRCVLTVDNLGNTNRVIYDSLGRVGLQMAASGAWSFNHHDDLGRLTLAVADLNGDGLEDLAVDVNQSYGYDDNSRLVALTDDNTNTTFFVYDSLDNPVQLTLADGTHRSLIWSPRSNLILQQDANGTVITNAFDLLDRCVARTISPGGGVAETTTFTHYAYDGLSRTIAATNDASHSEFTFDSLGNCLSATQNGWRFSHLNDALGRCLAVTNPSGRIITYAYNSLDQVTNVSSSAGIGQPFATLATMDYEGPGRMGRIARANGINTRISWNGLAGVANAPGDFGWQQVSAMNHQVAGGGAVIDRRAMSYDRNQNKTSRRQISPFAQGQPLLTNTWSHDALNRVTYSFSVKPTQIQDVYEFTLDGNGNRQLITSNGIAQPYFMDPTPQPGPADFQMNQYTLTPFAAHTYDENGNQSSRANTAQQLVYGYDFANRLVSVTDLTTGLPVPVASYAYGPFGERVRKTVFSSNPLFPPTVTDYIHDHGRPEVCFIDQDDDGLREIRVDGALIDSYIHLQDDGLMIGRFHNGVLQHYLSDELGNTLALTDSGGGVLERFDYGAFGEPRFLNNIGLPTGRNSSSAGNPFLLRGMEWDSETGFYSSDYDPTTGAKVNVQISQRLTVTRQAFNTNPWNGGSGGCFKEARDKVKTFFETGDIPTQEQLAKVPRAVLKTFFETGDRPAQGKVKVSEIHKEKRPKVNPFANK